MNIKQLWSSTMIEALAMFLAGITVGISMSVYAWNGASASPPNGGVTLSLLGKWSPGSSNAVYYSTGKVGVGAVTTPSGTLETFNGGQWTNAEYMANGLQTSTGHAVGIDYTLYLGADATNHLSYMQSVQWGTAVAPLTLNARGGNVGINTSNASAALTVNGIIHTTAGGIKYPDGTIQTSAN